MQTSLPATFTTRRGLALALALAGACLFHVAGNSTAGYVRSDSLFVWLWTQWRSPLDDMAHGPLVVLAAGWLVFRELARSSGGPLGVGGVLRATAWLAGALCLHVAGYLTQMPRLSFVAAVVFVAGLVEWAGGPEARRRASTAYMLLALAMSWAFVDTWGLTLKLRLSVTAVVHGVLSAVGVEVARQGTVLFPAGAREPLEVAAACAGMRSTAAMLTLALLAGYLFALKTWHRVLLVVAALAVVWVGNGVRVLGLVALALSGGDAREGWLHSAWGLVVFVAEALAVFGLARWLTPSGEEERRGATRDDAGRVLSATKGAWSVGVALALLCVGLAWLLRAQEARQAVGPDPQPLPVFLGSRWSSVAAPMGALEQSVMPEGTRWDRRIYFDRTRPERQALVTVVWAGGDRTAIHRPELCLSGMGWEVSGRSMMTTVAGAGATHLELERPSGASPGAAALRGRMVYWFEGGGRSEATYTGMLLGWIGDRVSFRPPVKWAYWSVQAIDEVTDSKETVEVVTLALKGEKGAIR